MINADVLQQVKHDIASIPWGYEPNVKEVNALKELHNIIEEYLKYIGAKS